MDSFENWVKKVKEFGWGMLKVFALFSGFYLLFDILLWIAKLFAPNQVASFNGEQMSNSAKPMVIWISEFVHSTPLFFICLIIMGIWFFVLKNKSFSY